MDWYDMQRRRADNQIWNGAAKYGFKTDFRSFEQDGNASLYFNTAMGLIRHYYDYDVLEKVFTELTDWIDGDVYQELLWLGLERCAWEKAKNERPALTDLRLAYAKAYVDSFSNSDRDMLNNLKNGWFRRILGEASKETEWEAQVLNALEFQEELSTEQLKDQIENLFKVYFKRTIYGNLVPADNTCNNRKQYRGLRYQHSWAVRHLGIVGNDEEKESGFIKVRPSFISFGKPNAEKVRDYIESCFGKSILPATEQIALEKKLCIKAHRDCYFHITKGEYSSRNCDDAQLERQRFKEQKIKNKDYYNKRLVQNRLAIQQLAQRIRNTLLLKEDESGCHLRAGKIKADIAWRAITVDDTQIFTKPQNDLPDDLVVDILLDASSSQLRRQEMLATQAYILASAMTKCDIPVRVLSFCSVSGCTVLRMYRDYYENSKNEKIFDYAAAGWNRDGLALRAMDWLLQQSSEGHRLVMVLSDANPNDDQRMSVESRFRYSREYTGKAAVAETATEAFNLRKGNRTVLCLYSGPDCNLENARKIYGKDVVRITEINTFAETVGKLIQIKLQAL